VFTIGKVDIPHRALTVLNKGLNFVPTNYIPTKTQLSIHIDEIKALNLPETITKNIIEETQQTYEENKINPNLSKFEIRSINRLKHNKNIVIKPTDKNIGTAIIEKNLYIDLVYEHLSDKNTYKKLNENKLEITKNKINHLLNNLVQNKEISNKTRIKLTQNLPTSRPGIFYALPKLHKEKLSIRPIISNIGHPTSNLSKYLHDIMKHTAIRSKTYLKDSLDLIKELEKIKPGKNTYLITADIESLYTNIPNKLGVQAVSYEIYKNKRFKNKPKNILTFQTLLWNTLTNNIFEFDEEHYLQIGGTAMGTIMAPTYANVFLKNLEESRLLNPKNREKYENNLQLFRRYVDDILIIYDNYDNSLGNFLTKLKNTYSPLSLKIQVNKTVNFLDLRIKENKFMDKFEIELYKKPIGNNNLLEPTSNHPKHIIKNILSQELIRTDRNCNTLTTKLKHRTKTINQAIIQRYPNSIIKQNKTILENKTQDKNQDKKLKSDQKLELIRKRKMKITYNQYSKRIVKKIKNSLSDKTLVIHKNLANLKKILIRAKVNRNRQTTSHKQQETITHNHP
jgi:hypothetical protein